MARPSALKVPQSPGWSPKRARSPAGSRARSSSPSVRSPGGLRSPGGSTSADLSVTAALERHAQLARLDMLKARIRATSYGMGGVNWTTAFKRFDVDHSGELEQHEFVAAMKKAASSASLHEDDLAHLFKQVDADQSGCIDAEEFASFMEMTPDELARKKKRDANGQGTQEYIVMARCVLREQADLSSRKLGYLSKGEVVAVTDKRDNRLRVSRLKFSSVGKSQAGWVSETVVPSGGDDTEPLVLLAKLDRAEGQMGRYASASDETDGTHRRLVMLAQDKKWAERAHKENAMAQQRRRRQSHSTRQQADREPRSGKSSSHRTARRRSSAAGLEDSRSNASDATTTDARGTAAPAVGMSEAEHQLYGEMAAAALAECDSVPRSGSAVSAASTTAASGALRSLLLSLLENTPRWQWGRAIEREWPVLRRELLTLLAVSDVGNAAAADEAVASAMLRWRQEREASAALRHVEQEVPTTRSSEQRSARATSRVLAPLDGSVRNATMMASSSSASLDSTSKGNLFASDATGAERMDGSESEASTVARTKYSSVDAVLRRRRRIAERQQSGSRASAAAAAGTRPRA